MSATACCIGPGKVQKYATLSIAFSTPSFLVRNTPTRYPEAQKSLLNPYTTCSLVCAIASVSLSIVSSVIAETNGFSGLPVSGSSVSWNTEEAYTSSTTTCMPLVRPQMMASRSDSP